MKALILTILSASLISTSFAQQTVATPAVKEVAIPTAYYHKQGFVISPYRPYNILEVKHLKVGSIAYDPTTATKDQKTGKAIMSTAKKFRVPAKPQPKPQIQTTPSS